MDRQGNKRTEQGGQTCRPQVSHVRRFRIVLLPQQGQRTSVYPSFIVAQIHSFFQGINNLGEQPQQLYGHM